MRSVLITGANRGLGLALSRAALHAGFRVIATCRNPDSAPKLHALQAAGKDSLSVRRLDLNDTVTYREVREWLEKSGEYIDVLIHNAGINYRNPVVAPESSHYSVRDMLPENMLRMLATNAVAPLALTRELLPRIRRQTGAAIAFLSSGMGSIGRKNDADIEYSYSASKAALNMLARVLAFELRDEGIAVVVLNPGWVATDMGTTAAPLQPGDVSTALIRIVTELGIEDTGTFIDYKGSRVPW